MWGHIRCATPPPPTESHSVTRTPPRRPARLEDAQAEAIIGAPDPAEASLLAHETAQALVDGGRGRAGDPELVARLVGLVESEGLKIKGALYFTCMGRGETLAGQLEDETAVLRENLGDIPLMGLSANGEIAGRHLHSFSGVLTIFL